MTIVVRFLASIFDLFKFISSPYSTVYRGHFEVLLVKIGRLCEEWQLFKDTY